MPGRVSTRASNVSRSPQKSTNRTLSSRPSTVLRTSSPTAVIPDEGASSTLRSQICSLFADAQRTTAGHRKLIVGLRKVQEACCYEPTRPNKTSGQDFDEDDFSIEIARCVIRLMAVKKTEGVGDRIVRFLGLFLQHASGKDAALVPATEHAEEAYSVPETPTTRLTAHILSILLPLLASKEKTVRYRSTQLVSHIVNSLDSIDDEYYHLLKMGLLKRVRDKEPMVRVQAVLGLGRLAGNEGEEDHEDEENDEVSGLLEKLLEVLQHDPSADVRRSLLLNLPLTPSTLPYLLERARDLDPATRRALYSRLLPALGDFRHLSLSMREKLLRWGLRDRDENVRKATARLFRERWIEDCVGSQTDPDSANAGEASLPSVDALLELLERVDIINSGVEDGIALEAMKEFWAGRPDYRDAVSFADSFWDALSAESVFMARSFNDFCRSHADSKYEALLGERMPEVTKLAFVLERYFNDLVETLRRNNTRGGGEDEDETVEQEFIVEQLLHIAKTLDYADEVGRRKMFALLRETLSIAELPDEITKLAVDVLREVCGVDPAGEREFCGVVLEAVAEVHDTISTEEAVIRVEDESFVSAKSEISVTTPSKAQQKKRHSQVGENEEEDEVKAMREIMVNMKCLHIAQCMLQNVEGNLQQNIHLVTMLNNLVVPAVRSHEAPIRERGLLCLGLCCLLDKTLAEENLSLFVHCYNKGHDALQTTAIQILADMLTMHPSLLAPHNDDDSLQKSIYKVFAKALKTSHTPDIQSAATTSLCKLMLTSIVEDEELLKQLVLCYFDPVTKDNAGVRQALSYFLPVYCHSRRENMARMGSIVLPVIHSLINMGEELEEEDEMIGMNVVSTMLVDWTDTRKLVLQDSESVSWDEAGKKGVRAVNGDLHLDLAEALLERALSPGCPKEEKKILITMLGKLYITANSASEKLSTVCELVVEAIDNKIASDATSRNALNKLHATLSKAIGEAGNIRAQADEGMTVAGQEGAEAPAQGLEDETKMELVADEGATGFPEEATGVQDSVLEELLDDDDDEETG